MARLLVFLAALACVGCTNAAPAPARRSAPGEPVTETPSVREARQAESKTLAAPAADSARADAEPAAATERAAPATRPADPGAAVPADQMLGQMLKPRRGGAGRELAVTDPPAPDATSGDGAVKPGAPALTVVREGSFIVNRVGRLTRGADGRAEFAFEADGGALRDPPMVILPNLKLMVMEDASKSATRFRVSGTVTEYRGRNYVLLEKVYAVQDVTQQFKNGR